MHYNSKCFKAASRTTLQISSRVTCAGRSSFPIASLVLRIFELRRRYTPHGDCLGDCTRRWAGRTGRCRRMIHAARGRPGTLELSEPCHDPCHTTLTPSDFFHHLESFRQHVVVRHAVGPCLPHQLEDRHVPELSISVLEVASEAALSFGGVCCHDFDGRNGLEKGRLVVIGAFSVESALHEEVGRYTSVVKGTSVHYLQDVPRTHPGSQATRT